MTDRTLADDTTPAADTPAAPAAARLSPNFEKWVDGLGAVEEDHVFAPIGAQSAAMTELLNERTAFLEQAATNKLSGDVEAAIGEEGVAKAETAVGQSFTEALADVDARIAAQLDADHPDAPRFRLRGLSDDDYSEVNDEMAALIDGGKVTWTKYQGTTEANLRLVARAIAEPEGVTTQDVRMLRKKLNRGEWARLLEHVTRLANADAEATDLPN